MSQASEVLHIYLSPVYRLLRKSSMYYILGSLKGIIYVLKNIYYFLKFGNNTVIKQENIRQKIWLICSSTNNYNSLRFLSQHLDNTVFITTNTLQSKSDLKDMNRLSFHYNLQQILSFPYVFLRLFKKYGFFVFKVIDFILEATGMVATCKKILAKEQPKAVIFSNDHTVKNRALLLAAKALQIPSIYIQHASVTAHFPALKFDLSLLEGKDTLDKYSAIGPIEGEVGLIGMPKFDGYESFRNNSATIQKIGICSQILDEEKDIIRLVNFICNRFPKITFSYRPHPRDKRLLKFPTGVHISNSKSEMVFDFLKQQDFIIAANTSLHLEATMLNVRSVYYPITPNKDFNDAYGYVKNKLIDAVQSETELERYISSQRNKTATIWKKASYYNATINTEFEGKSKQLALRFIQSFLKKKQHEINKFSQNSR